MIWLTWRQHRKQALAALLGLVALAAVLVPTGLMMHQEYADTGLAACLRRLGSAELANTRKMMACDGAADEFNNAYGGFILPAVLLVSLPLLVGMFLGASLVGREVEQGTHRLVWTQGVTRLRWTLVKFGLVGGGALLLAVGYAMLTTWWITPLTHTDPFHGRFEFPFFDLYGAAPVGYTGFALALGLFAGAVSRRTLPAMAVTVVGFLTVRAAVAVLARPRFVAPLRRRFPVASDEAPNRALGDWILSEGVYERDGTLAAANTIAICPADEADVCGSDRFNIWTYQPGGRFWLFQYLETGLYLALAAVLIYLTVRVVRRLS